MEDDELHPLPDDHPGVHDPAYRQRRSAIATAGATFRTGHDIPEVAYSPEEDDVWRVCLLSSEPGTSSSPARSTSRAHVASSFRRPGCHNSRRSTSGSPR